MNDYRQKQNRRRIVPVIDTMPADLLTPLSVYLKLSKASDHSFLLESVEGGESLARYSFIGVGPQSVVTGDDSSTTIRDASGTSTLSQPLFEFLRQHFSQYELQESDEMVPFVGGAMGFLGFDCCNW